MNHIYYYKGKQYLKVPRNGIIKEGACQSYLSGSLYPIMHTDTVGQSPKDFSDKRNFYNPIHREEQ